MKAWKHCSDFSFTIDAANHRNPVIDEKQFYSLFVQCSNDELGFCWLGLAHDLVAKGHIYYFVSEANRDMIYKYVMNIKD